MKVFHKNRRNSTSVTTGKKRSLAKSTVSQDHEGPIDVEKTFDSEAKFLQTPIDTSFLKYKPEKDYKLIVSGDTIKAVFKQLQNAHATSGGQEELFEQIDARTMTDENKQHYRMVVQEMTKSERVHLMGLQILKEVYLQPIIKGSNAEHATLAKTISGQIDTLINVHKKFLAMMEEGEKSSQQNELPFFGEKFVKNIQFLKMASNFITKYPSYLEGLTAILKKDKDVVKNQEKAKLQFMKDHPEVKNINALSFYLITPIQRIPRYELLIRDMLKDVGKDFPDVEQLKKAYLEAKESAKASNTLKCQYEEAEKMKLLKNIIEKSTELSIDKSARRFICCGPMYPISSPNDPPKQLLYYFLFNDLLVETKVSKLKGESVKKVETGDMMTTLYRKCLDIMDVNEMGDCSFKKLNEFVLSAGWTVENTPHTDVVPYGITLNMENIETRLTFAVNTDGEKDAWETAIVEQLVMRRKTLDNITTRKKHISIDYGTSHDFTMRARYIDQSSEFIRYKTTKPGELVSGGDTIKAVLKALQNPTKLGSEAELFKEIDARTMTDENKKHYRHVVQEMTASEKVHLNGLQILKEIYLQPIIKSSNSEHSTLGKKINSDIDTLINVHKKFLAMMEEGEKSSQQNELPFFGEKFVKNIQFLKMASSYITKYNYYLEGVTALLKKDKEIVKNQEKAKEEYMRDHPEVRIQLISFYLITPIQRIPRYELLIRDMLKDVGKDFPDVEQLKKAYLEAKESAKASNALKCQHEEGFKMLQMLELIDIQLETISSRRYICSGPMFLVKNLLSKPTQWLYFFLFSDRLIGTRIRKFKGEKVKDERIDDYLPILSDLSSYEELEGSFFEKEIDAPLTAGSGLYEIHDNETVANLISCRLNQIPYKFSCQTPEEAEAWNALLFDQIEKINVLTRLSAKEGLN